MMAMQQSSARNIRMLSGAKCQPDNAEISADICRENRS